MKRKIAATCGCLFLAVIFFAGYEMSKKNSRKTDQASVQLSASIRNWSRNPIIQYLKGKNASPELVLSLHNPTNRSQTMVYPYPIHDYEIEFSDEKPLLLLMLNEVSSSYQKKVVRCFMLAESGPAADKKPKVLTLNPGETVKVVYKLSSFYLYGMGGVDESSNFTTVMQPGKQKIALRAAIAYSEADFHTQSLRESPSVTVRCDFPQYIFVPPH